MCATVLELDGTGGNVTNTHSVGTVRGVESGVRGVRSLSDPVSSGLVGMVPPLPVTTHPAPRSVPPSHLDPSFVAWCDRISCNLGGYSGLVVGGPKSPEKSRWSSPTHGNDGRETPMSGVSHMSPNGVNLRPIWK